MPVERGYQPAEGFDLNAHAANLLRKVSSVTTVAIVAVGCIFLFALGLISPHLSIKGEHKLDFDLDKADRRVRRWPFPFNKMGDTSVRVSEWMVNRSSAAGRKTRRKAG